MHNILLVNTSGHLQPHRLGDALPAGDQWQWARDSIRTLTDEVEEMERVAPALHRQFAKGKGLFIITEKSLVDIARHFFKLPEEEITPQMISNLDDARGMLIPIKGSSRVNIPSPKNEANIEYNNIIGFSVEKGYGKVVPHNLIAGSPYKEMANAAAHEICHGGNLHSDQVSTLHSGSPLFEMVMKLDNVQRGKNSARAHTEAAHRHLAEVPTEATYRSETLSRAVENIVHEPAGNFHPLVKAYVDKVFIRDMEFEMAGREDLRAALRREIAGPGSNLQHPLHGFYKNIDHVQNEADAGKAVTAVLDYINGIEARVEAATAKAKTTSHAKEWAIGLGLAGAAAGVGWLVHMKQDEKKNASRKEQGAAAR